MWTQPSRSSPSLTLVPASQSATIRDCASGSSRMLTFCVQRPGSSADAVPAATASIVAAPATTTAPVAAATRAGRLRKFMGVVLRGETVDSKALSGGPTSVAVTDSPPSARITGSGDERGRTLRWVSGLPDTRNLDDIGDENRTAHSTTAREPVAGAGLGFGRLSAGPLERR